MPFELSLALGSTFYLVYPEAYSESREVKAFRNWLVSETRPESS